MAACHHPLNIAPATAPAAEPLSAVAGAEVPAEEPQ